MFSETSVWCCCGLASRRSKRVTFAPRLPTLPFFFFSDLCLKMMQMFEQFGLIPLGSNYSEPVKTYTLEEQTALASKTSRKVRAFLHGAYKFEARYADYPGERDVIESGGVVLTGAQLNEGTKYYVLWDFEGESGKDCWKFRGGDGFACAVCDMEDSMADDPNIWTPASVLQMAASEWAQSFYDMAANYETYGGNSVYLFPPQDAERVFRQCCETGGPSS
ncbi:hypothetical protein C8F04DRAFT_101149 [Mycena alexandri]|uniref:Uncharacterized protein n=1 Tax=Mycena alexandri TaxID=1745969 RepID=A0AAD6SG12_9AGAR|nr:hypothetical protein C8F04DRAFT_101149 [Mycena alexandri]